MFKKAQFGRHEEKGARYKLPAGSLDRQVVKELVDLYTDWTIMKWRHFEGFDYCVERLDSLLQPSIQEGLDLSVLLNAIILDISMNKETCTEVRNLHQLLDPLMQAFYDKGQSDFYIDLTPITLADIPLAHKLRGGEGRLLSLKCKGDLANFGKNLSHCELELFGKSGMGGSNSTNTIFKFHGSVERFIGDGSTFCDFHFYSDNPDNPTLFGEENTYHYHKGLSLKQRNQLKESGFSEDGNHLLVPDGAGWKEVTP